METESSSNTSSILNDDDYTKIDDILNTIDIESDVKAFQSQRLNFEYNCNEISSTHDIMHYIQAGLNKYIDKDIIISFFKSYNNADDSWWLKEIFMNNNDTFNVWLKSNSVSDRNRIIFIETVGFYGIKYYNEYIKPKLWLCNECKKKQNELKKINDEIKWDFKCCIRCNISRDGGINKILNDIIKDKGFVLYKIFASERDMILDDNVSIWNDNIIPNDIKIPPEMNSLDNLDNNDVLVYNELNKKYSNILTQINVDKYFLKRFTLGWKHLKYKKRLKETINAVDMYLKYHNKYNFNDIINIKSPKYINHYCWPMYIYGQDIFGHPIYYDLLIQSNPDIVTKTLYNKHNNDAIFTHLFRFLSVLNKLKQIQSKKYNKTITKHIQILDFKGFNKKHLCNEYRKLTKNILQTMQVCFPESAYKIFIINAPKSFRTAWTIIKTFMDNDTKKKISILGSNYINELTKHIHINMIPKYYGGNGKWIVKLGDIPFGWK